MVKVIISAPNKADAMRLGRQVQTLYQTGGKVVRFYDGDQLGEHEVTRCDVAIIIKQEVPHG